MNARPQHSSLSKRSRSLWPLALGLAGHPLPGISPEHMQLARELTDGSGAQETSEVTRGSLPARILDSLLQGLHTAGRAHAQARGLMLY